MRPDSLGSLLFVLLLGWGLLCLVLLRPSPPVDAKGHLLAAPVWDCPRPRLVSGEVSRPGLYCQQPAESCGTLLRRAGAPAATNCGEPGAGPSSARRLRPSSTAAAGPQVRLEPLPGETLLTLGLPLDLNRATVEDLESLPGIGPGLARRIAEERALGGPFPTVAALDRVRGVGPERLRRLEPMLEVSP